METRRNTNKKARASVMPNTQKRRPHDLPKLQRNITTKHILQDSIKHNTEQKSNRTQGK